MLINKKYKMLQVSVDGEMVNVPSVKNSYLYTLWVLRHKYSTVVLHGVTTVSYIDYNDDYYMKSLLVGTNTMQYNIPPINPIVSIKDIKSIIVGLGVDAVLILGDFSYNDLIDVFNTDIDLVKYSECSTYFDNHIIKLQIKHKKIRGTTPKLRGINYHLYTNRSRRAFNRQAEHVRKLLKVESNIRKLEKSSEVKIVTLTPTMREYYESQLHEFVYTYIYKGKISYGE